MDCVAGDSAKCDSDNTHVLVCKDGNWIEDTSCQFGCEAGKCSDPPVETCPNNCINEGGRIQTCVTIGGSKSCKNACLKSNKGENIACYQNGSIGPKAPIYSIVETCVEDDNGLLYASNEESTECNFGCNEESGECSEAPKPDECPNNCINNGGRTQTCVTIGGSKVCKNACLKSNKGENIACYQNGSIGPEAPIFSVVETCVEDDNGLLYASNEESTKCDNGCNEESGECSEAPKPDECPNNCINEGGRTQTCVTIDGSKLCKNTCLKSNIGENTACYQNGSIGPEAPIFSVVETCVEDDNGLLYASNEESTKCDNGCDDESGKCRKETIPDACPNNCINVGGRAQTCVTIDGTLTCKNTCLANNKGDNKVCYQNASLGPNAPAFSIAETCIEDDNGLLYASKEESTECDNECDDESGECLEEAIVPDGCPGDCIKDGGRAQKCVTIFGAKTCKNTCLGTKEGQNLSCYQNGSLGPDAPSYSVSETCAMDDNGILYSTKEKSTQCDNGCDDESGKCINEVIIPGECPNNCANDGGHAQTCVIIDGVKSCQNTCLGTETGQHSSCYRNASLGPDAPVFSVSETCALDDNGQLYSTNETSTKCDFSCNEASGECEANCELPCETYIGSRTFTCVLADGVSDCEPKCLSNNLGQNRTCLHGTTPSSPSTSVVEICKTDPFNTLYSAEVISKTECPNGCDETTGKCNPAVCENLCPVIVGTSRRNVCVTIDGTNSCKYECYGITAGENASCHKQSTSPMSPEISVVEVCKFDSNGTLYSVEEKSNTVCENGCNYETGKCK